ncbi:MAG: hypothetical protein MK078_08360 [Crocinitomicaceae bacterium]|nr:hypothetical protein [Crocinitomicaceae bacterium]
MHRNIAYITIIGTLGLFSCNDNSDDSVITDEVIVNNELNYSPADFNNDMMMMVDGSIALVDEVFMSDSSDIVGNKEKLLFELDIYKTRFETVEFESGGDAFRTSVESLVDFYKDQFTNNFSEVEGILLKGDWTDEEDQVLVEFDEAFADMEGVLITSIEREQESFSEAYSIQLVDRDY